MGMVRCTKCANVFNALAAHKDAQEVDAGQAVDLGNQLPIREFGDAVVIEPNLR